MAVVARDKKQDNQGGENVSTGGGASFGLTSGDGSGAAGGGGSSPGAKKGSGFVNVQDYIATNKTGSEELGQGIEQEAGRRADRASEARDAWADSARKSVKGHDSSEMAERLGRGEAIDADEFKASWDAYYQGPENNSDIEGYGDVQESLQDLSDYGGYEGGFANDQSLLRETFARPNYTSGENKFDAMLLGGTAAGRQGVANARNRANNEGQAFESTRDQINSDIESAQNLTNESRENLRGAYNKQYEALAAAMQTAIANRDARNRATEAERQGRMDRLGLGAAEVSPEVRAAEIRALGISPEQAQQLEAQGYDLSRMLDSRSVAGAGAFLGQRDRDAIANLNALAGVTGQELVLDADFANMERGTPGGVNATQRTAAQDYFRGQGELDQRVSDLRSREDQRIADFFGAPDLAALGLEQGQYDAAQAAGLDLQDYFTADQIDRGDVMTDADRQRWQQIIGDLGIQSGFDTRDDYDETGLGGSFDKEGLLAAIADYVPRGELTFDAPSGTGGGKFNVGEALGAGGPDGQTESDMINRGVDAAREFLVEDPVRNQIEEAARRGVGSMFKGGWY